MGRLVRRTEHDSRAERDPGDDQLGSVGNDDGREDILYATPEHVSNSDVIAGLKP
jgi:hypothetical protein